MAKIEMLKDTSTWHYMENASSHDREWSCSKDLIENAWKWVKLRTISRIEHVEPISGAKSIYISVIYVSIVSNCIDNIPHHPDMIWSKKVHQWHLAT
mmetsp:Transcript_33108/g.48593  ORF Transcript_33108/g.48593 Transcript_33108/m.48593 type:complete len:97 (-) Transcript_33108:867-1157(-)